MNLLRFNRAQQLVIGVYFLALAYCCLWLPWSLITSDQYGTQRERIGYGWIWAGPRPNFLATKTDEKATQVPFGDIDDFVMQEQQKERFGERSAYSQPDLLICGLRFVAVTAIAIATLVLAGGVNLRRRPKPTPRCEEA